MRTGIKTAEFGIIALGGLLGVLYQYLWPDRIFPIDSFITLSVWVGGRFVEKIIGPTDTAGKRYYQTTEFWVAIGLTVAEAFFADKIPTVVATMIWGYIGGRPLVKATAGFQLGHTPPPDSTT